MKKLIVIGAGISGLAMAVYAARSGYDVTVLEQHILPGGLSTSWKRKGYYFEGGMHWLTGSSPKLPLNRVWREVGALKENNPVYNRPVLYTIIGAGKDGANLELYRDLDKLEAHLTETSPSDKRAIHRFCSDVRKFQKVHLPINDLRGLKSTRPCKTRLPELMAMGPAGLRYSYLRKTSYEDYVNLIKNPSIRHLLSSVNSSEYNALSFVYTLGQFTSGDCGFPEGGSIRMAQNMADTLLSYGGKIEYRTKVQKIVVEDARVKGVMVDGNLVEADRVAIGFDTLAAVDTLFDKPLDEPWVSQMKGNVSLLQCMFFGIGVRTQIEGFTDTPVIPLEKEFEAAGLKFPRIRLNYYSGEEYAPAGCSTLTCLLIGDSYDFWKGKKLDGTYQEEKKRLIERFVALLEEKVPQLRGKVEVTDLATPCTYERYTSSYRGSWMSIWKAGKKSFTFPSKSESIEGLYFANERVRMPGGLPICGWSGRNAAQWLCRDDDVVFNCGD
ncbi:MAG: NAD(P)/FAD-dependent oxidoreductase [Treponema sp.]|nr:NAD(P)/FAD-dependent oxidoreductase [Treponema sp.]